LKRTLVTTRVTIGPKTADPLSVVLLQGTAASLLKKATTGVKDPAFIT
jgi:hypothetical protein